MATNKKVYIESLQIPAQLEDALGFNITRLAELFRRELVKALVQYDMTPEQWQVLAALWWTDRNLSQVEIGQLTLKEKPTVSRMIEVMSKKGWIKKVSSTTDARATEILLTAKGRKLREEVPKKLIQHFVPFFKQFSEKEHNDLMSLTKKLRNIFNDRSTP